MKGFSGFKSSPTKAATDPNKNKPKDTTPPPPFALDPDYNVPQRDLDGKKIAKKKKSPAKQEGPIPKKNIKLQKGEMEGTWVYEGKDKNERIIDLEDRAEYARSDAESAEGKEKKKHLANAKKLQHEADIIRNRKPNKKK